MTTHMPTVTPTTDLSDTAALSPPPASPSPANVLQLGYSSREERPDRHSNAVNFLRRLALSAGISIMTGAMLMGMFPRSGDEVVAFCFGLGLVLLAMPLPKMSGW